MKALRVMSRDTVAPTFCELIRPTLWFCTLKSSKVTLDLKNPFNPS